MRRIGFLSIALATVVAVGCDSNRTATTKNPAGGPAAVGTAGESDSSKVSSSDKDFVNDLTIANMAEVELGKMAIERSTNAEVKKFGQMMVDDHTLAGDKLKSTASQHNIAVPAALDDKHQELREKLAKLQGTSFDREYMAAMADGHETVLGKLESRIDKADLAKWKTKTSDQMTGKKSEVRGEAVAVLPERSDNAVTMSINQWAAEAYPTVQAHLTAAKSLDSGLKKRTTN